MNATTTIPRILTEQDVMAVTGVARGTLAYWRHCGTGPKSFKMGRLVRYAESDLVEWLETQRATTSRGGQR